jgi:hypothetical protein
MSDMNKNKMIMSIILTRSADRSMDDRVYVRDMNGLLEIEKK